MKATCRKGPRTITELGLSPPDVSELAFAHVSPIRYFQPLQLRNTEDFNPSESLPPHLGNPAQFFAGRGSLCAAIYGPRVKITSTWEGRKGERIITIEI